MDEISYNSNPFNPDNIAELNQVKVFQYSVPFTVQGGDKYSKNSQNQWKKTTTLIVKEPFPCESIRQVVILKHIKDLTPIESAMDDLRSRYYEMQNEMNKNIRDCDKSIVTRILQGTIAPQVS